MWYHPWYFLCDRKGEILWKGNCYEEIHYRKETTKSSQMLREFDSANRLAQIEEKDFTPDEYYFDNEETEQIRPRPFYPDLTYSDPVKDAPWFIQGVLTGTKITISGPVNGTMTADGGDEIIFRVFGKYSICLELFPYKNVEFTVNVNP